MQGVVSVKASVMQAVVERGLCSGCGVCAGICPCGALKMQIVANGDLNPVQAGGCSHCGLCVRICPFAEGIHDGRGTNEALFGLQASSDPSLQFHDDIGWFRAALVGHSDAHRPQSASGGLLSLLLERLLESAAIDRAAVVGPIMTEQGASFTFRSVASASELRACAGSVYQPVEISGLLREMQQDQNARWAIVGVPCLCSAVREAGRTMPKIGRSTRYVLGLACGMYQNRFYTELLCRVSGVPLSRAAEVKFRVKSGGTSAANYGFQATSVDGTRGHVVPYQGLPFFLGSNGYFRCSACDHCRDVFAESADACFMDAWAAPYCEDPRGTSLVLLRDAKLESAFADMARMRGVTLSSAPLQVLLSSQAGQIRRKRRAQTRVLHSSEPRWLERFDCWLQKQTQRRSKYAWARYGARHGLGTFWLAVGDLWLLQQCRRILLRLHGLLGQLIASVSRKDRGDSTAFHSARH